MRVGALATLVSLTVLSVSLRGQTELDARLQSMPWERYQGQAVRLLQE